MKVTDDRTANELAAAYQNTLDGDSIRNCVDVTDKTLTERPPHAGDERCRGGGTPGGTDSHTTNKRVMVSPWVL